MAKENLLILRPDGAAFQDVVKGMTDELDGDFGDIVATVLIPTLFFAIKAFI